MVKEFVLLPPSAFNSELIYYLLPKIELQSNFQAHSFEFPPKIIEELAIEVRRRTNTTVAPKKLKKSEHHN